MTTQAPPAQRSVQSKPYRRRRNIRQRNASGYAFLLPALLVYAVFMIYPFGQNIYLSLTKWNGINPNKRFVGLANYSDLLVDQQFWQAVGRNLLWAILGTTIPLALGLLLAMLLRNRPPGYTLFRIVFFTPQVLAPVVVAIIFSWVYDPSFGILSRLMTRLGFDSLARAWLAEPETALFALIAVAIWVETGFAFIILLAALQDVDIDLLDAAKIDGANAWASFRYVTVPQIANGINLVAVALIIAGFSAFDYVWVMTRGGPANSTEVTATYLYRESFVDINIGYGAAISTVSTLITLVVAVIVIRLRERE